MPRLYKAPPNPKPQTYDYDNNSAIKPRHSLPRAHRRHTAEYHEIDHKYHLHSDDRDTWTTDLLSSS
eukprot:730069-Pyramimonas_sp.AAC.1